MSTTGSYIVRLSSNLEHDGLLSPMEIVFMEVELHGAISLYRFTSDRQTERFDLSSAEVNALVAANRRRLAFSKRAQSENDALFVGDHPF